MKIGDVTLSQGERLTLALLLALAIHILILGIHLARPQTAPSTVYSLNISLLKQERGEAATLAPSPGAPPTARASNSTATATPPRQTPTASEQIALVASLLAAQDRTPLQSSRPSPTYPQIPAKSLKVSAVLQADSAPALRASPVHIPSPLAAELGNGLQIVRALEAKRPSLDYAREKRINPESMTTVEEYYVQAWERKIEQVATLNFPKEALRRKLSGRLTLDVALNADGSVHSITLVESSGYTLLDNAAREIVELAGPYAPFPEELRHKYDVLHIPRIWSFLQGDLLD